MKLIIKPMLFVFSVMLLFTSCNTEDLFVEDITEVVETPTDPEDNTPPEDAGNVDASLPCDFNLNNLQANQTVIINCIMDLGGATINVPANVTLIYEGGDVINGTLNFASNTTISGELLNSTLTLTGSNPIMKDPAFEFNPKRWGIVEGVVSDAVALKNRDILESVMLQVKNLDITTFKIDKLDAYFKVDGFLNKGVPEVHAVNIPSDFKLVMTNNTHLRMQPNGHFRANLLAIHNEKNITVTGGFLHGDRETHNYNSGFVDSDGATGTTNEWVNTMSIKGGENITIDGVTFQDATGDGLTISSIYFYYDSRHIRSKNINIVNNKFLRARRINLTLVNCEQIFIENNDFVDGGIDTANSKGTAPSCDFNIEPVRGRDANGNLIEYERVSHVYMRNNRQKVNNPVASPSAGGFFFSHGNGPIIFENNEVNSKVSFSTVEGLIIRNNTINAGVAAGIASNTGRTDFVFGNEIYGNKITGGVNIAGNGVTVRDNEISGDVGVYLGAGAKDGSQGVSNSIIKNNTIKANQRGIMAINTTSNTTIEGNTIDMLSGSTFALSLYNNWTETNTSNFIVSNNIVTGTKATDTGAPTSLIGANSISVINNSLGCVQITGGNNTIFKNNKIDAEINKDGLVFNADCPNSEFTDNTITIYTSKTPLKILATKVKTGLTLSSSVLLSNNITVQK